jgi:hypothetical protein
MKTRILGHLALLVCLSLPVMAQEVTGSIVGTVTDPTGAAVAGATVTVTATDKNLNVRTVQTDGEGNYVATLLPVGLYQVKVEMKGFKPAARSGIELHVSDKLTISLRLEVGEVTEQVVVEAAPVAVDLQTATATSLISGTEVTELALNNRNYIQLIGLMPGVTNVSASDEVYIGTTNPTGGTNTIPFALNGGRNSGNNFMVDGADNVDRGSNLTLLAYPSVDAIAEFKAMRNTYTAEFGRGATGQINVITKSGTNKVHGSVYEFNRNDKLAANNFFNNFRKIARPPLRYNNFGYTIGGPVPIKRSGDRNRTFFFWSHEFRRVITYATLNALVPMNDWKSGKFSQPVCLESSGNTCVSQGTQIPASQISPLAQAYIKDIWSSIPEGDASLNLFSSVRSVFNYRQELIKIDHTFTPSHAVSVRFINDTIPTVEPGGLFTGSALPGVAKTNTNSPGRGWTVRSTNSIRPTVLNEAGWSYSYGAIVSRPDGLISAERSPDIHAKLPFAVTLGRVPTLSVSGVSSLTGYGPYDDYNRNHNIFDNLTKIAGKHTIKVGMSFNFYQKTENAAGNNAGTFATTNTPRPTGTLTAAQGWANFLLGNVSTFTQASLDLTPDVRSRQLELYVQDDFRVRSNLTLNLGVRYSSFWQPYDANNMLTNFDPARWDASKAPQINPANGNILPNTGDALNGIVANGGPYGSKVSPEDLNKFAPRVGFSWDPFQKGKTAIRGGYGLSYDSTLVGIYEQNIFANPPYVNSITISNTKLDNPAAGVEVISAAPKTIRGTPMPPRMPYTQQWSLDTQHQITPSTVIAVGYYGSKGTHLLGIVDMNSVRPGQGVASGILTGPATSATTPLLNAIRPYRGYGPINTIQNWFNSSYNSLQVSVQKRMSGRSSLRGSYTWSKVMTDATSDRSNAPQNFYDRKADRARATFDRTQVLTLSYVYELPVARHASGVMGAAFRGWQLSGIATFMTGPPLRVTSSLGLDWAGLGIIGTSAVSPRPDRVSDPNADAPHTIAQWFNTAAFAAVPTGQYRPGNAAATTVGGPGMQRFDVSLMRNIQVRESMRVQLRLETFNLPNHTNFQGISTALGSSNYGQVTSARDPRRIQLGAKLTF